MINIIVIYNDKNQLTKIGDTSKYTPIFRFIDSLAKKSKNEAKKIKSYYSARLDPFAVVLEDEKPIRAFYSEAEDVIDSLIKYLNNYGKYNDSKCN